MLNDTVKSELNRLSNDLILVFIGVLGPLHPHCALGEGNMLHFRNEVRVSEKPKLGERPF